ncbi:hypothetical protein DSM104329_02407 [Capillimicrobium parvum]|uniref:Major facilitator superfamily (MFS) profile domain-containing protein n=2 Tax=Capillimicrobium parvum TaxID=2884022 RepID=A0A9E6XXF4_9ACTN|nr:hypothetical protein DSM104329_02407 [Capillimicrobium parvum]
MFWDSLLYSALAPVLPAYADRLSLSDAAAGLLSSAFPAGVLLGALPAGVAASRLGGRRTVLCGLVLLAISGVAFGFGQTFSVLVAARFLEGIASVVVWAGALTWLVACTPAASRAATIGRVLGAGVAGTLVGPLAGAGIVATSPQLVFCVLSGGALVLAVAMRRLPAGPPAAASGSVARIARPAYRRRAAGAIWLVTLPAVMVGMLPVLGALRLDALGAGAAFIAATFVVVGTVEAAGTAVGGNALERVGARRLTVGAYALAAMLMIVALVPQTAWLLACCLVAIVAPIALTWTPAMLRLRDVVSAARIGDGHTYSLFNLAFAGGQMAGAAGGGVLADIGGQALPWGVLAGGMLVTSAALLGRSRAPERSTTTSEDDHAAT